MPQDAIDRLHHIAKNQNTPEGIKFAHMDGIIFENIINTPQQQNDDTIH